MGYKSFITPVYNFKDFKSAVKSINKNTDDLGIDFILKLKEDTKPFSCNSILIAWGFDIARIENFLKPKSSIEETWQLEFLPTKFKKSPDKLGQLIESPDQISENDFIFNNEVKKVKEKKINIPKKNVIKRAI